ncbi:MULTISPECIES: hypothetical protein [unclassified Leifsonia]|uniref:hypothetical protein n=1 Tax=unclassified Leifsonia TaxID=2663824 RepID=UPI0006F531FB|nr:MULTISPECIES: hypothetical protein [unclassified Leifsonia]KQX08244.1 hypothetical protein ASC59_11340 [Leifsonia sp. Root1293]KRA12526.1 hypothetical protein ASD61_11340 [Leifsonia sp. Root60]
MADLDAIAASVVSPLANTATNVVRDAFLLAIRPEDEFDESAVAIEELEFASSAVGGLSSAASTPAAGTVRSTSRVEVPLADSAGGSASAGLSVTLYGPGDVRGIDPAQIVRRFPAPGAQTAEETVLAHIEFDRPELPWAFSATKQAAVMRPWLTLVVLERSSVIREPATSALLPVFQVPLAQLPVLTHADLWAHAQAPATATGQDLSARLSPAHARVNLSRVISPRILTQDTDYIAALVPTTDVGVRGGLGLTGGTLEPAWTSSSPDPVRLPVYDSWEFRTGPNGDFRSLALKLEGVAAPYEVGRKFIDTSQPGKPLLALGPDEVGRKQVLRCALFSPSLPKTPEQQVAETAVWPDAMIDKLHKELDLPAAIEGTQKQTAGVPELPIIGPRIYAKLHRGSAVIEGSDWFSELNLAPVKRIVGGLGTRVVQRDQERLMQSAWAQLGEVEAANRAIRLAQLAELLATRLHSRLGELQTGHLLQVTSPLATRISVSAGSTLFADVTLSATPVAATSGAFRRVTRPAGPMIRRTDAASQERVGNVVGTETTLRDFTRVYSNPEGIGRLTADVVAHLDLQLVSAAIGTPVDAVDGLLKRANAEVEGQGGFATYLTEPSRWRAPDAGFDLGAVVAEQWTEKLLRSSPIPVIESIRAQRVGPLAAELSLSKTTSASPLLEQLKGTAVKLNDRVLVDLGVVDGRPGGPVIDGPIVRGPVIDGPVIDGPVIDGPIIRGPVIDGPIVRGPVVSPLNPRIPLTRRSPIGGAVGRLPQNGAGAAVRVPLGGGVLAGGGAGGGGRDGLRARRIPVDGHVLIDGRGLRVIDVRHLKKLGDTRDAAELDAGLAQFADLAEVKLTPTLDRIDQLPVDVLRAEMTSIIDPGALLTIDVVPHRDALAVASPALIAAIDPKQTVRASLAGRLHLSAGLAERWFAQPRIAPIMAAPRFDRPMYRALEEYDRDWLVPGLGLLPADDFVTVLSTNREFMAAFFVGLSDEMGRELLWRGYPTDQRGTYFHRFWNPNTDELAKPIHLFPKKPLAEQVSIGGSGGKDCAVIVVKSELVRRFPDLIIQAVENQGTVRDPVFEKVDSPQKTARVLFSEVLDPDIALVGVDISVDELDGEKWWITIAEHPSATRFKRPPDTDLPAAQKFLTDTAPHSAVYAEDHLHRPVRVAFQATDLIVREA